MQTTQIDVKRDEEAVLPPRVIPPEGKNDKDQNEKNTTKHNIKQTTNQTRKESNTTHPQPTKTRNKARTIIKQTTNRTIPIMGSRRIMRRIKKSYVTLH